MKEELYKKAKIMFDPNSLVGKEVRALGDADYGHRVLNYYSEKKIRRQNLSEEYGTTVGQYYVVETIYWDNGELVNENYLGSLIKKDDLHNKYDVYSPRESSKVSNE